MKEIVSVCIILISLKGIYGQYGRCFNPNQRPGVCVSIYDCQTILSVLERQPLHPLDVEFIRSSKCSNGFNSDIREICCTADTGFTRSRQRNDDNGFLWESPARTTLFPADIYRNQQNRGGRRENSLGTIRPATNFIGGRDRNQGNNELLPKAPKCGGVTITSKIYGGADADLFEFPWMVLLEYNRRSGNGLSANCAGTLINQRYVITAAHCVQGEIEKRVGTIVGVRLGEYDTTRQVDCNQFTCAQEAARVGIEEVIVHERYKPRSNNQEHDVALLRLDQNVRYSNSVLPICLPSAVPAQSPRSGQQFTVAGWGRTLRAARSAVKQKLNVFLIDKEQCRAKFAERKVKIVDTQLCAGGQFGEDSCDGDSGGPLMRFRGGAWVLEGVVSFGFKCGLKDWPGVYTDVAAYEDWIRSNIRA